MKTQVIEIEARLLDIESAAKYFGVSVDSIKYYIQHGIIVPVPMPSCRSKKKNLRRVLIDRYDLDRLIDAQKSGIHGKRLSARESVVDQILRGRPSNSGKLKIVD